MGKLLVNLVHYPIYTLGPGERVGLWLQGCTIRCKGCMSPHTWIFDHHKAIDVDTLARYLRSFHCDHLTVSGGEPFDQPDGLQKLLTMVRKDFRDILVYTGYPIETLREKHADILKLVDALIDSPFVEGYESELIWKGSENQRFFLFNRSLLDLYTPWISKRKDKVVQMIASAEGIILVGIPYQKDVRAFRHEHV